MRGWWALPAALLGGVVGLVALVVHRHAVWLPGGWPVPWGVALAVATPTAVAVAMRGRNPALLGFLLGWALPVLVALGDGPGGDFLLMSDVLGWGYLVSTVLAIAVVLVVATASPEPRRGRPRREGTMGR
ncbi:MAG: hypothetical protein M3211_03210 [Actinomycetota bacterium]|nr:hypothetical protein [Actinomycetota bacterium]